MLSQFVKHIAKRMPSHSIDIFGSDSLLFSSLPYYVLLAVMVIGIGLFDLTGNPYLLLFIIYGLIPSVDQLISLDTRNPTNQEAKLMANQIKFQIPLYITVVVDWYIFFYAMNQYSSTQLSLLNLFKLIGFAIVISNLNAAQFSVSHEIMHKSGWRRVVGTLHMLKTLNMHFTYEHLFGHHRKVATLEDPATARKNQNVYKFFIRSYFGAYISVYSMERQQNKPIYKNAAFLSCLANICFCFFIFKIYGFQALIFCLIQVLGAVFYLQVINFIEHYGLLRKKLENGSYQKVNTKHSWNAPHRLSNYLFFKLQRHSDHHQNATKPYQTLLTIDQSPQLPNGYIIMTVMALFPSIYHQIMNPLVQLYNQKQNIKQQKKREIQEHAILASRKFVIEIFICVTTIYFGSAFYLK